jgi:hypothetical protein
MRLSNIKAPKFRIKGKTYNEYELREIILKVGRGELPTLKVVQVDTKQVAKIKAPGYLTESLDGLGLATNLQMELVRFKYRGR